MEVELHKPTLPRPKFIADLFARSLGRRIADSVASLGCRDFRRLPFSATVTREVQLSNQHSGKLRGICHRQSAFGSFFVFMAHINSRIPHGFN